MNNDKRTSDELGYELLLVMLKGDRDYTLTTTLKEEIYDHAKRLKEHLVPTMNIENVCSSVIKSVEKAEGSWNELCYNLMQV